MTTSRVLVLVVEDDNNFAALVGEILFGAGYDVAHFIDANAAVEWLKSHKPQLIVSDIGLPGISGIHFCRILKSEPATASIPIIVLSALGDEPSKVDALRSGADDYVVKPFSGGEFLARIEAILRRVYHQGNAGRVLVSGSLRLDLDAREARLEGKPLLLLPKEYALLEVFLKGRGHVLSFCGIAESVWGLDSIATRATIKSTVHRLRTKLGNYGDRIESVLGFGYKWTDK
jgi:DNA-binding response OmpR family regulator